MCVTDGHDITLAVKVALNPNTTNQPKYHNCLVYFQVILSPESFFSLDSAYELDFDEIGNRKKDRFHIINLHHMQRFEPLNLHTNMDTGSDGTRYLPYRLCHIFTCETLKKKENVIGESPLIS